MQESAFFKLFNFRKINFMDTHHNNLSRGIKHNYIGYIEKGCVDIVTENETFHLCEGDVYHIPKGLRYHSYWKGTPQISFRSYAYMTYPGAKPGVSKLQKFEATPQLLERINLIPVDNTINCFSVAMFYLLLNELLELIEDSNTSEEELLLDKAMKYIQNNHNCLIPEVAKYCNISESGLYTLFKKHSNITPSKFKLNVKLDKALNYLVSTDIPIEKISELCGFSSPAYFRKNFFKMYKNSPREIRKSSMV